MSKETKQLQEKIKQSFQLREAVYNKELTIQEARKILASEIVLI